MEFTQQSESLRGGMTLRRYTVRFLKKTLRITTFWMPDGTLEQYTRISEMNSFQRTLGRYVSSAFMRV